MNKEIAAKCIITDGGGVLFLHLKESDEWQLPGGRVEHNETIAETISREIYEELRVNIDLKKELGVLTNFSDDSEKITHYFLGEIQPHQTIEIGEPQTHTEFAYLPLEDLDKYALTASTEQFVQAVQEGRLKLI